MIKDCVSEILNINLHLKPKFYLLGIFGDEIPSKYGKIVFYMVSLAWICYAQKWKCSDIPTKEDWMIKLYDGIEMDKLTQTLRNENKGKLTEEWSAVIKFLKENLGN